MKRSVKSSLAACSVALVAISTVVATSLSSPASPAQSAKLARGKYIVEGVGMCADCHTPRDEKGEPIPGKTLQGAVLGLKPIVPMPVWADKSPNIAGLPGWTDEQAVKFLMTGAAYNGLPGRPPMPQYRMNRQDAEAVVAYLRSLAPTDK
ncbi:MAG: cytochrome c [Terriglobales bacterium]|jgi:mono/diheme cytochrome c family protein